MDPRATNLRPEQLLAHTGWVRRLAGHLVAEATDADDVSQQALLAALERPPPDGGQPRAWLATVIRHLAARWRRTSESRVRHESAAPIPKGEAAAAVIVERANTQRVVVEAVLALDEPYRSTILMKYFEELDAREVAARLEVPVETVRTRLKRGIATLRARLESRFGSGQEWVVALSELARLATSSRAATTGIPAALVGGAIILSTKLKLLVAAVALVVAGVTTWSVMRPTYSSSAGSRHWTVVKNLESETASPSNPPIPAPATSEPIASRGREAGPASPASTEDHGPSLALHGVVRDKAGAVVEGAAVVLEDAAPDKFAERFARWTDVWYEAHSTPSNGSQQVTLTKRDGTYTFNEVPHDGTWNIAAIHERSGFAWNPTVEIAAACHTTTADLVLEPGLVVSGTVTDEAGSPVADADVGLTGVMKRFGEGGTWTEGITSVKSDAEGHYQITPTPLRDVLIQADKHGYFSSKSISLRLASQDHQQRVDLQIERGRIVSGRLLDKSGVPVALAGRRIRDLAALGVRDDPTRIEGRPRDHSNDGSIDERLDRYEFAPICRDAHFVAVYARELLLGSVEMPPESNEVDVVLDFDRLPKAEPLGRFTIVATDAVTHAPIRAYSVSFVRSRSGTWGRQARDESGTYRSELVPLGSYRVSVIAKDYAVKTLAVEARESDDQEPVEFALVRGSSSVFGTVFGSDGAPIPRARVYLCLPDGEPSLPWSDAGVETDSRGRFSFRAIADGTYVLMAVDHPDEWSGVRRLAPATAQASLSSGDAKVDLRMEVGIPIRIQPVGRGVESASVMLRVRDERGAWVVDCFRGGGVASQSGGSIECCIAPGNYSAEVYADHFRTGRASFSATPDLVVSVEMVADDH